MDNTSKLNWRLFMNLKKVKNKNLIRWEVRGYSSGRNSKRIRRRFKTKIDAQKFIHLSKNLSSETPDGFQNEVSDFDGCDLFFLNEAENWINQKSQFLSASYIKRVEGIVNVLNQRFPNLVVKDISRKFLNELSHSLLIEGKATATVNRWIDVIRVVLSFSYENERISTYPLKGYKKLKEVRSGISYWEREQIEQFISFVDQKYAEEIVWVPLAYRLVLNTGLRAGELWGLRVMDLDSKRLLISIKRQFNRVTKTFTLPKSKKERSLPCPKYLMDRLLEHTSSFSNKNELIFRNGNAQPINHSNFRSRFFLQDIEEAGVEKIRFHDLRHTAITMMVDQGINIKIVQEIAGHKDLQTTLKYLHLLGGSISEVSKKLLIV